MHTDAFLADAHPIFFLVVTCLMFESSLFESQFHAVPPRTRWTAAISITLQAAIASLLAVLPLLHTERMPAPGHEVSLVVPTPAPPPLPRTVVQRASSAMASVVPVLGRMLVAPRILPQHIDSSPAPATAAASFGPMGAWNGLSDIVGAPEGNANRVTVTPAATPKKAEPVRVSAGVSAGLLLAPIRPVYPPIAKAAHVEGTVIVEAIISKAGTIESLRVVNGPAMLQSAAMDAIRAARYQPFRLNGEPTEVQTTITVNFRMSS